MMDLWIQFSLDGPIFHSSITVTVGWQFNTMSTHSLSSTEKMKNKRFWHIDDHNKSKYLYRHSFRADSCVIIQSEANAIVQRI